MYCGDPFTPGHFVNTKMAMNLGCAVENINPISVLADGTKLAVTKVCIVFSSKLRETTFTADCMLIQLRGCDMVFGIQWLSTLGQIVWGFQQLQMEFKVKGCYVC